MVSQATSVPSVDQTHAGMAVNQPLPLSLCQSTLLKVAFKAEVPPGALAHTPGSQSLREQKSPRSDVVPLDRAWETLS